MLSVLIPIYNYNSYNLVKELHQQLLKEAISFEIICLDDASKSDLNLENEKINKLLFSSFSILKKNIGRSAIRNLLASKAKFNWLLFLDADVLPTSSSFISNYIKHFNTKNTVFCGGLKYQNKESIKGLLRYKYGKKHEEISVEERVKNAEKYFFTSNFLIEKKAFSVIKFEEKLLKYGREDFLFSIGLKENNYKITHIENEVFHLGIDNNSAFVAKTKNAMENLIFLSEEGLLQKKELSILNFLSFLSVVKIDFLLAKMTLFFEKKAIDRGSVFFLNCLKICYLCQLKNKNE
ncbi:glycosyltransferase family A protein [Polaribacter sargassicola]|uniref:glycosyltransferase family A protein n=1 Tax=Polaribacter sargassicola TaxID=2836891 RepID=UPI001F2EE3C5|nr:glycosyltransferase family A protein [Polaribacter sp. DS7-9]MCG1035826.1 glycosyltransferase family 2 protein [Polaribacter sp. DS7-9]